MQDAVLKSTLFGGFEKNSVETALTQLIAKLNALEAQAGVPLTKFDASMLKKTKIGSGYAKESVLLYTDMLSQQIFQLEVILKK